MNDGARLTVICALASEALALIEHWRLPSLRERPFRVFGDEQARIVISGVGSHACAAAVGYAAGLREARADDIWLNLGIAGHGTHDLGAALLAARISHHGRDGVWYPSLLFTPPCEVTELETHDRAVTDYPPHACCDMEAAGFMAATSRIANGDLAQVMKVVSDNAKSGIAGIERQRVHGLMRDALPVVLNLVLRLREVAARLPAITDDDDTVSLFERWHFTHAQGAQLRQLLRRLALLSDGAKPSPEAYSSCRDAAAVLAALREEVDRLPLPARITP